MCVCFKLVGAQSLQHSLQPSWPCDKVKPVLCRSGCRATPAREVTILARQKWHSGMDPKNIKAIVSKHSICLKHSQSHQYHIVLHYCKGNGHMIERGMAQTWRFRDRTHQGAWRHDETTMVEFSRLGSQTPMLL